MPIPEPNQKDNFIPSQVAEIEDDKDIELQPFLISFAKYNYRMCEVQELKGNKAKKSLRDLIKIGKDFFSYEDLCKKGGINNIPVRYEGEYKKLFKGLHPDVEMFEHKIQENGRIFYYINDPEKIFCIIAIRENHLETKKQRK